MENAPTAPAEAPKAPESEATPTTNQDLAQATPNLHGFTEAQLAEMEKFYSANGGYEKAFNRVKSAISNPEKTVEKPVENPQPEPQKQEEPVSHIEAQPVESQRPQGRTNDELLAEYYFEKLSQKPEYAPIAKEIANGDVLMEMSKLGIQFRYADGSWNNDRINDYLTLRAKTVPAKPTESEPNASSAPTVTYTQAGDNITNIDQAYKIIMEPGNPDSKKAEDYIKSYLNRNSAEKK